MTDRNRMTRDALAAAIERDLDGHMRLADIDRVLRAAERQIAQALASGSDVDLYGFGRFSASVQGPRPGRNPQTGATIAIGATVRVNFKPSRRLRDALPIKKTA